MKRTKISVLLCMILSLMLCGCQSPFGKTSEVTVYDAFSEQVEVTGFDGMDFCCYHVPAVKADDQDCVNINQQIYSKLYASAQKSADNSRITGQPDFIDTMSYEFYQHGDLYSIVVWEKSSFVEYSAYHIYTFNPLEDRLIESEEVLRAFNCTETQLLEKLEEQITAYYRENWEGFYSGYTSQLQQTLDYLSADTITLFAGPDGSLCVAFRFYNVAGAECSDLLWNVETGKIINLTNCSLHSFNNEA